MARSAGALRAALRKLARPSSGRSVDGPQTGLMAASASDFEIVGFERGGLRWVGRRSDHVTAELFSKGSYQGEEIEAVDRWLRRRGASGCIVDVGANIGSTSVTFAARGWRVVAIEPVPDAFDLLRTNVIFNAFEEQVTTVRSAVSSSADEVSIALAGDLGHSEVLAGEEQPGFGSAPHAWVSSPAAALSSIVERLGLAPADVALVWSDTQGHEADVIESGTDLWRSGTACFIEVWPRGLRSHGAFDRFVAAANDNFVSFAGREDLLAGGDNAELKPMSDFKRFVEEIDARPPGRYGRYSDALLVP